MCTPMSYTGSAPGEIDEVRKVDGSVEVEERQKRMKETVADPDDKEMEVVSEEDEFGDIDEEEAKQWYEQYLEWSRKKEQERVQECLRDPDRLADRYAYEAKLFRKNWDSKYGSFDKKTEIPCKRFTHNPAPRGNTVSDTLQVFYVKVGEISGGLQFPLEVFGVVALRDSFDYNRNIIFERERDNCQELTDERSYRSRLSTLDLMLAHMTYYVEATISVRVTSGSWPDVFCCRFVASTDSIGQSVVLLETANDQVPLTDDEIILAWQVVSVESHGNLKVVGSIRNLPGCYTDSENFKPLEMDKSTKDLHLGCYTLEVTVHWSCF